MVSKITVSNISFSVDGEGALPLTLAANSTTTLNVHFGPATAGSATGQLVITSNSLISPSATVQMTGTGVLQTQPVSRFDSQFQQLCPSATLPWVPPPLSL